MEKIKTIRFQICPCCQREFITHKKNKKYCNNSCNIYFKNNFNLKRKNNAEIYRKNKLKTDPSYRMYINISRRFSRHLKKNNIIRDHSRFSEVLKMSKDLFKKYIEEKFTANMCWENYGEWHIDHIVPLSKGKDKETAYKLNKYDNLQPIWGYENVCKGDKIK